MHSALAEDWSSVPSVHIKKLITTCNSSSGGSDPHLLTSGYRQLHASMCTHMHIQLKILKKSKKETMFHSGNGDMLGYQFCKHDRWEEV